MAVVLYDTDIKRGASLGPLSLLMKGETLPADSRWAGIPSEPMDRCADLGAPHGQWLHPSPSREPSRRWQRSATVSVRLRPRRGSPRRGCILAQFSNVMRATTRPSQRSVQLPTDDGISKVSK